MNPERSVFNHVGLCVTDPYRSRLFYENALGFTYWWELNAPEAESAKLLQLGLPLQLRAVYLLKDGVVLELLSYHPDRLEPGRWRGMAEPGLTHLSISVGDVPSALDRVERFGGTVLRETDIGPAVMVRDPDGQLIELLDPGWRDALPPLPSQT